jgi:hypothetical protein
VILKKISCKAILNKKIPALTNCGEKMLQNSMVAGIDLTIPRRSAGLIFRGLV